ncbi:DUF2188 domain-containing protein [Endozoicomonas montiporae]|uniref:DUF2188 domain-containing protein n=1 Tax=Endozoicomonas montiporae CL-33 TaxID=570277 RepID=A0A142BHA2_9GAMM|nr:DUF2188 domain-containing protein [Endozoicomonas montiporae]AMO58128.1 hypothetical protein EZMO1_4205 [Endozoicomonas montiporae CL-33]
MSDNDYSVYRGKDGKWRGKRQGASRSSVTGSTQKEVIDATRELTRSSKGELSIHRGDNGRIRDKWSYGNDPRDIDG